MSHLDADTRLDIRLSAICARHQYDTDPTAAIAELRAAAGDRGDILARVTGTWAGYYEGDPHRRVLVDALKTAPGAHEWIAVGRERAGRNNSTGGLGVPYRGA